MNDPAASALRPSFTISPLTIVLGLALVALLVALPHLEGPMHWLFPEVERPVYQRASFVELTLSHLGLVLASSAAATLVGVAAGIFATRQSGAEFEPLINAIAAIGQTFPPVAVLAICVPLLGYGGPPTLVALAVYATLPVTESTMAGLHAVSGDVKDAAEGLGFSAVRRLIDVELPLASPIILNGIRISVIINIGTATIGSTIGALTLGSPIIEGLSASNPAYVVEGAVVVALLAILTDRLFEDIVHWAQRRSGIAAPEAPAAT
jgi:osmoprotectant transport system permease protein